MRRVYFSNGYSIVEILVAIAVLCLFAVAATTFITSTQSQLSLIKKKQSLEEYSEILRQSLALNSSCDWQLQAATGVAPLDLSNVTAAHPGSLATPIPKFYSGANTASTVLFENGQNIPFISEKIQAGQINLKNITPGTTSLNYFGDLVFSLNANSALPALKPITIPINFLVDGVNPLSNKKISKCCVPGGDCNSALVPMPKTNNSIFCHAGNNQSNNCVVSIFALNPGLLAYGVSTTNIKIINCKVTSYYDDGHGWGGSPYNSLNYDPATGNVSLAVNQAGVTVGFSINYNPASVGLIMPTACN